MIPGIVAAQTLLLAEAEAGAAAWLPAGAVAHLDFVNGNYYAGGAERLSTDLLGGEYDPARIGADGLFLQLGANILDIRTIGPLYDDIMTLLVSSGCTFVFDFLVDGAVLYPEGPIVYLFDNDDPDAASTFQELTPITGTPFQRSFEHTGDAILVQGSTPNLFTDTGVQTIAAAMNVPLGGGSYRWSGAINGNTGQFGDTTDELFSVFSSIPRINFFAVGQWDYGMEDVYCRRVTIYPGISDMDELAALAAPYTLP